jgi:hypothetical protein
VTSSRLFWFVAGIAVYWGVQHFTGLGKTGKASPV